MRKFGQGLLVIFLLELLLANVYAAGGTRETDPPHNNNNNPPQSSDTLKNSDPDHLQSGNSIDISQETPIQTDPDSAYSSMESDSNAIDFFPNKTISAEVALSSSSSTHHAAGETIPQNSSHTDFIQLLRTLTANAAISQSLSVRPDPQRVIRTSFVPENAEAVHMTDDGQAPLFSSDEDEDEDKMRLNNDYMGWVNNDNITEDFVTEDFVTEDFVTEDFATEDFVQAANVLSAGGDAVYPATYEICIMGRPIARMTATRSNSNHSEFSRLTYHFIFPYTNNLSHNFGQAASQLQPRNLEENLIASFLDIMLLMINRQADIHFSVSLSLDSYNLVGSEIQITAPSLFSGEWNLSLYQHGYFAGSITSLFPPVTQHATIGFNPVAFFVRVLQQRENSNNLSHNRAFLFPIRTNSGPMILSAENDVDDSQWVFHYNEPGFMVRMETANPSQNTHPQLSIQAVSSDLSSDHTDENQESTEPDSTLVPYAELLHQPATQAQCETNPHDH